MGNLKLKIVLTAVMLVFAIVPAVIVGAIGTFSVMGYERSAKENTLQQVGESKSAGIKQAFKSYSSIVGAIAKSEAAVDVAHGMGSADAELEAAVAADPDILDMMILDDSGTVIEAVNGSEGGVFENLPMNDQGVINMPSVSEMLNWTSYGDAIFVADPIPSDNASGEAGYVVAIVSAGPDSAVMKALSGQFVNLSGASFMIVDKNGVAVNYKQSGSINKEFAGSALQSDIAQFFDTSNSGYSDLKNSKDIKSIKGSAGGSTYFVGLAGTDVMNWRWVASADNAAFSQFSTTTNLLGWVVVAASAVVFSIASLLVIGRFLGNMNGMLKTMTEISEAEGSTDIRFKVTNRRSELGEIQTSFNELLDEVFLSEERHRTIAELSDNMLFEWDFHKERMYASKNMLAKFDIDTDSATLSNGKFIDSLMSQDDAEKYKRDMNGLLKNKSGYSAEYQLKTKSGAVIWVSLRAVCITDRLGEPLRVIGVMTDIDNEKKLELQLSERASYDFLSQLYNRNTFIRNLTSEIERRGTKRVAVSFIDVDDFKFINDRYGHTIGDEVIRFVADTIRTKVDDRGGFAGRFGGDEFVLCFTNQDDIANIENISMDIINELYEGYTTADGAMHIDVKASIGVAFCPEHTEDVNELLSFADTAMYFVKKNGKTNYHIYIPEDSATDEYIDPEGF
ncbi:MAG TPA: sensor domain-containing diguanylate cyclase [Ruminococcaceae bacterium]|nr:sensor domain-containing diguanylate cyclase [Oscillospiraceae bacterium]HCK49943.1 sensor domain-containing diguanylate cyclase [Oscillospiraceae bacterium]